MTADYEPFGEEWQKEISKFPKKDIIQMLADTKKSNLVLFEKQKKWTDKDFREFAEWCSFGYEYNPFYDKWRKSSQSFDDFVENIENAPITSKLIEMWKKEKRNRNEKRRN